ncbi:hypothetical protein [Marinomonas sp. GJ51-6]|uniref:hypothetical protein n=1 Tax=Marinomonas sp. GJ51-6 TaxID=2992802 RepID=UPI002934BD1D|nr:hypothetical protein [Marinomonas sp. GJ51-6]WOD07391.1 hypothetical protein ONZ50_17785 [Marinomonas sp. GJ51-6]
MKKTFFKKLQSLTAILVLNTLPAGVAQASVSYESEVAQARVLSDDRRNTLKQDLQEDPLKRLYFENTLAYVQKHQDKPLSHQHHLALTLIEEAYQDDLDTLLDHYEFELESAISANDESRIHSAKNWAEQEIAVLKEMRSAKIAEFNQQFSVS